MTELSASTDTLEFEAFMPTRSKWAIVYWACASLKRQQMLRRSGTNVFHNAEKPNVVKLYELQRVVADFENAARLESQKGRQTPKVGRL